MKAMSSAAVTMATVAAALGCTEKQAPSWLRAMGFSATCGRCGGSGSFSYNPTNGTRCFGCAGRGTVAPKLTRKLVAEAAAKVAAGEMAPHLARWRAANAARKAIAPLVAKGAAAYDYVGKAYSAAHDATRASGADIDAAMWAAQTANNALLFGALMPLADDVKAGRCTDYVAAERDARAYVVALRALRIAYKRHVRA